MTVCIQLTYLKQLNILVNCSHILIFLKPLACYTISPDTHQWYRINTHVRLWTATILQFVMTTYSTPYSYHQLSQMKQMALKHLPDLSTTNSQLSIDQLTNGQPITNSHNNSENNKLLPDSQSNTILP